MEIDVESYLFLMKLVGVPMHDKELGDVDRIFHLKNGQF